MRRHLFILTVFMQGAFSGYSQAHFITMGQTQNMIYTDFIPDQVIFAPPQPPDYHNGHVDVQLDINQDNFPDFTLSLYTYGGLAGGYSSYTIEGLGENYFYFKMDTNHLFGNPSSIYSGDTGFWPVAKRYLIEDAVYNNSDTFWTSQKYQLDFGSGIGGSYRDLRDFSVPGDTDFYCATKTIIGTDTLLGYVHFSSNIGLKDFACEGPTSSHIISSVDDRASLQNVLVYPNPFTNEVNIDAERPFDYQIADYTGRIVLSGTSERSIFTTKLTAGGYLLKVKNQEVYLLKRIIKYQ